MSHGALCGTAWRHVGSDVAAGYCMEIGRSRQLGARMAKVGLNHRVEARAKHERSPLPWRERCQIVGERHPHTMSEGHWRSYPPHLDRALSRGRSCAPAGPALLSCAFRDSGSASTGHGPQRPTRGAGMLWREWTPSRLCGPSCDSWQRATCLRSAQHRVRAPCAGLLRHLLTLSCASQSTSPTAPRSAPHRKSDLALFRATGSHRAFFHRRLFSKLV